MNEKYKAAFDLINEGNYLEAYDYFSNVLLWFSPASFPLILREHFQKSPDVLPEILPDQNFGEIVDHWCKYANV